eukprot:Opistho-2@15443
MARLSAVVACAAVAAIVACMSVPAQADIYMHNLRGSNNRLDEARRDRNNANRLFDSQNNNRGGYNVGSLYYYTGSTIPIEWTNQHSCGSPNANCEIVFQYTCGDNLMRDGTTTNTIPTNPALCANNNCDTDPEFGRHEPYEWYMNCKYRTRNYGLFTANQLPRNRNQGKNTAQFTRQNNNANRFGYECPEERDYYPYWQPTMWRDIAILTTNVQNCPMYQAQSQNVKPRYFCDVPKEIINKRKNDQGFIPITQTECEALRMTTADGKNVTGMWTLVPAFGIAAPECREAEWTRDNHLGNVAGGYPALYNWTIPADIVAEKCVFRVRYNISTADYPAWNVGSIAPTLTNANSSQNQGNDQTASIGLPARYFADKGAAAATTATSRGYVFKNNPNVQIFADSTFALQLAINPAQYGRTFQDRSHIFAIRPVPTNIAAGSKIHNLNVKGKRGNIVQVFPGVEYDFVPTRLHITTGHYVHPQWTGSNTNPNENAGQGKEGTDRSNMILTRYKKFTEIGEELYQKPNFGDYGTNYPSKIDELPFLGFSYKDVYRLAILRDAQFGGEMSELDDAGTYFDLGVRQVNARGVYHYMCTRNNNFSNRDQKGTIIVSDRTVSSSFVGWMGATIKAAEEGVWLIVPQGAMTKPASFQVTTVYKSDAEAGFPSTSSLVQVQPLSFEHDPSNPTLLVIPFKKGMLEDITAYRVDDIATGAGLAKAEASISGGSLIVNTNGQGGTYYAKTSVNGGKVAGIVIGCLAFVGIAVGSVVYFRKNPESWDNVKKKVTYIKRSFESKV